jgi:hypothetical protein
MTPERIAPAEGAFPLRCRGPMLAPWRKESRTGWLMAPRPQAGSFSGTRVDPNVCPNCGRAVNARDVVAGSRAIGDHPSEIARCKAPECSASLARVIRTDGSRGAWSAVVATDAE